MKNSERGIFNSLYFGTNCPNTAFHKNLKEGIETGTCSICGGSPDIYLSYKGRIYVRPMGRGICLIDAQLEHGFEVPQFEDFPDDGYYEAELKIIRKIQPPDDWPENEK